jgi:hypothetical protein
MRQHVKVRLSSNIVFDFAERQADNPYPSILTFLNILLYRLVDLKSYNTALTARSGRFGEEYGAQADEAHP